MGYFKLADAFNEVKDAQGGKQTAFAGAKLLGKTIFNAGKLASEVTVAAAERAAEKVLDREDLTPEQREKAEDLRRRARAVRLQSEIKALDEALNGLEAKRAELEDPENGKLPSTDLTRQIEDLTHKKQALQKEIDSGS